jgi:hypothetical protein
MTTDAPLLNEESLSINLSLSGRFDTPGKREEDQN